MWTQEKLDYAALKYAEEAARTRHTHFEALVAGFLAGCRYIIDNIQKQQL